MKELEDYSWFPQSLRTMQMDFIGWLVVTFDLYKPIVPIVEQVLVKNRLSRLYDLCSGAGHPAIYIKTRCKYASHLSLSDKYPQRLASGKEPIEILTLDVLHASFSDEALYTMFNAFHHFNSEEQTGILEGFKDANTAFVVAEILEPSLIDVMKILFTTTIGQLVLAPFVTPFSLKRLMLTYILPINLFTVSYDGLISVFKSKTISEYRKRFKHLSDSTYQLEFVQVPSSWGSKVNLIVGTPTSLTINRTDAST